ncbi:4'-phosphopantetheinyl transferase [Thermoanaerobacterium thermosaccharolyticum DSM 571]|uniref:4'-phosphopantetheinyl transferase n=1 Tax=Thermoanaerobacterium thermosaccharolyticum (strain ATCC 7956 / DSM 571 / NCIMB 9385 / NCA 3814 / NCTC 13789 / WDCM 00135 / 2032) TaxID=580327 RepID=D9TLZ7_THETC|nr:4'-phosphopantetheinyl transferase superfamily protein [Thermoanaerobacterium thermosaccharolyticum]ADL68377.1 4'-phosphopantetheinyl transferase [Thermoanaerobacterium thermosaccharolyticum DSM 571]
MVEVYATKITRNVDEEEYSKLLEAVSEEKRWRVKKIKKFDDALRTLLAEAMLRVTLVKEFGLKNSDIVFYKNEFGKPFLKGKNIFFSISHSGEWASIAVDCDNLGVDIEKVRDINLNVAKRFFSMEECNDMMKKDDKIDYFFTLWTLKESYVKALGKGLYVPLKSFTVKLEKEIKLYGENKNKFYFKQFNIDVGYKLAVCAQNNMFQNNVNVIKQDDLLNNIFNFL